MDLMLAPLGAEARPLEEWLTTFHLAIVVLDPYTNESSWILPTATRILEGLRGSDARVAFLVAADAEDARLFLGPLTEQFLVFIDPDRIAVKALGLTELPAFVFVRVDGTVQAAGEGWSAPSWKAVADAIADATAWRTPDIPLLGDPGPFRGSPRSVDRASRPPDRRRPRRRAHRPRRARRVVVSAPPGAGKTTVVPLALLGEAWLGGRRIVMLEPRRLATRAAARRMADLTGPPSAISSATRPATSAASGLAPASRC